MKVTVIRFDEYTPDTDDEAEDASNGLIKVEGKATQLLGRNERNDTGVWGYPARRGGLVVILVQPKFQDEINDLTAKYKMLKFHSSCTSDYLLVEASFGNSDLNRFVAALRRIE